MMHAAQNDGSSLKQRGIAGHSFVPLKQGAIQCATLNTDCGCKQNSAARHLLVALIQKTIRPLQGQVVQVMAASVQHPSKPDWNA